MVLSQQIDRPNHSNYASLTVMYCHNPVHKRHEVDNLKV